jgi:sialate O-acetylesterase
MSAATGRLPVSIGREAMECPADSVPEKEGTAMRTLANSTAAALTVVALTLATAGAYAQPQPPQAGKAPAAGKAPTAGKAPAAGKAAAARPPQAVPRLPPREFMTELLPEEAKQYQVVYRFDPTWPKLKDANTAFVYDEDNSAKVQGALRKVAYFMAIENQAGEVQYAFVSMDPFTDDIRKIGVPVKSTGARFQQKVTGVTVKSNVAGVANGEFPEGCNIEFWDCNYGPANPARIPDASSQIHDFGDFMTVDKSPGYGSMQIHNWKEKQTILAFNRFAAGRNADVGIGNSDGKTRDWTFSLSATKMARGEFKVLVLPK